MIDAEIVELRAELAESNRLRDKYESALVCANKTAERRGQALEALKIEVQRIAAATSDTWAQVELQRLQHESVVEALALTPEELHVVWVAAVTYLTDILTGHTEIITDQETWIKRLHSTVEKLSRSWR